MLTSLARHSFGAILLAVVIEELGLPLPIPTDVMIVFAGATAGRNPPQLLALFVALSLASAVGGSGLYVVVRRGGRPLVERFGRYVHLGPERLDRAEALLARGGWGGIAFGRAVPGLRYATAIACGLCKVPYPRFVTAHVVGSSVYVGAFLALGAIFGPAVLARIHLPAATLRLLWLLLLAIGLPLLVFLWGRRVQSGRTPDATRGRLVGGILLGSLAGATALAATLSAAATVAELLGARHPLNVAYALLGWLFGFGPDIDATTLLLYSTLLAVLMGLGAVYYELVLPYVAPGGASPSRQVLGLAAVALGFFGILLLSSLFVERDEAFGVWWQTGAPSVLVGVAVGGVSYALTTVYGRALVVAAAARQGDRRR